MVNDEDFAGLKGPIEYIDDRWQLHIPIFLVSEQFMAALPPGTETRDHIVEITIPGDIIPNMGIQAGELVWVGLKDGLFTVERLAEDG